MSAINCIHSNTSAINCNMKLGSVQLIAIRNYTSAINCNLLDC